MNHIQQIGAANEGRKQERTKKKERSEVNAYDNRLRYAGAECVGHSICYLRLPSIPMRLHSLCIFFRS